MFFSCVFLDFSTHRSNTVLNVIEGCPAGFAKNDENAIGFCMKSIGILLFAVCFWLIPRLARGAFGGPKRAPDDPPPRKGPGRPRNLLFLIKDLQQNFSTKKWIFCDPPDPRWSGGSGSECVVCFIAFVGEAFRPFRAFRAFRPFRLNAPSRSAGSRSRWGPVSSPRNTD